MILQCYDDGLRNDGNVEMRWWFVADIPDRPVNTAHEVAIFMVPYCHTASAILPCAIIHSFGREVEEMLG